MTAVATDNLRERALATKAASDAEAEVERKARAQKARDTILADAKRLFERELGVNLDDPSVMHYWSRDGGGLRVTTYGGLLIGFYGDPWNGNETFTLIRECTREGCQHSSDPVHTHFTSLYQLGVALEEQPHHSQDCTVEWDEDGDPIHPAKPRTQRDIVAEIAEDLGVIPGQAPEWFLQYQMRVSHHVAKLHTRINEVAAAQAPKE